jgi:hypothetical protein
MPTEWDGSKPLLHEDVVKPVTTNPGLPDNMRRILEEISRMEYAPCQKRMYEELLPQFAEERLLHVSGAEQIARQWYKRWKGSGDWGSLAPEARDIHIKAFAQLINEGVIVAGPQLFRQVD